MSCDIAFARLADRAPLEHRDGYYRCVDTPACAQRRALKYGKQAARKYGIPEKLRADDCGSEGGIDPYSHKGSGDNGNGRCEPD
jgi:hypothetical protein